MIIPPACAALLATIPTEASAFRPDLAIGAGWSLPLDARLREVYGGAPLVKLGLGVPVGKQIQAEAEVSGLRMKSTLTAPSFLDHAEGTLTMVPIRLGVAWLPRGAGPWLHASAVGLWSRESVRYEVLGERESVSGSRFDPGASLGGGWVFRPHRYRIRAGIEAAWVAGDREVLRESGDPPKAGDASAGSHLAFSLEARF